MEELFGGEEWQEKVYNGGMEEAPENGKESSLSAHANGMNEYLKSTMTQPTSASRFPTV
jgi:hypothetical protein